MSHKCSLYFKTKVVFVCFVFKGFVWVIRSHPGWLRAVVTRISIQAFYYLLMCIITLQMSQLNNMELASLFYKQIQSKLSLSRSFHSSLWLSWDLWCSDVLPHFRLKAAAVYLCSSLKAATIPFLWAKARWHHISIFFICYDCPGGKPKVRGRPQAWLSLFVFLQEKWMSLLNCW